MTVSLLKTIFNIFGNVVINFVIITLLIK